MKAPTFLIAAAISLCTAFPAMAAVHASVQTPGNYYVALGDSVGFGYRSAGLPIDPTCGQSTPIGYVCAFYDYLKQRNPHLTVENLSVPGADSCVITYGYGNGSPCTHKPTLGATPSALQAAIQLVKAHPGQVTPITVQMGGDDLLPLLPTVLSDPSGTLAKLPGVMQSFRSNLDTVLQQLRGAAGPNATIIVITQYNPLGGIGSPPLPTGLPALLQGTIDTLNNIIETEAGRYNARVADVAAAFNAHQGGASALTYVPATLTAADPSSINIHPTDQGYQLYTATLLKASGYLVPLAVRFHLTRPRLAAGAKEKVKGRTAPRAELALHLRLPGRAARTISLKAAPGGAFAASFSTAGARGKGSVKVCAADAFGQRACAPKQHFVVR